MKRIALALALTVSASAEIPLPDLSPAATVEQAVGVSRVKIAYHRPAVRGRKVWGALVPFGQVWRLGANNATTLELSHDATLNGNKVPAGKYSLFAIPEEKEWTVVVNKKADQWGAYAYKAEEDQLRFRVPVQPVAHTESFDIDVVPLSDRAVRADISWERVRVPFTIEFDTEGLVWKSIDETLARPTATWEDFHNAARYALRTNKRIDEALAWANEALKNDSFWNYELKGLVLHAHGRDAEAIPLMQKAKELAQGKAPQEWFDGVDQAVASWKAK